METSFMTRKLPEMIAGLALFALLATPVLAAERQVLKGHVPAAVARLNLQPTGRLPATDRLHLAIGLPLRDTNAAADLFQQIYDRRSTQFHRYLTPAQFAEQFGPAEKDYQKVINYAKSNRLEVVRTFANRALVSVEGNVADIEAMFHVKISAYQHPTESRTFFAPDVEPSVDVGMPILYISGIDNYSIPHRNGNRIQRDKSQGAIPNGGSDPRDGLYMGHDFQHAYVPGTSLTGAGQVVGLFEPQGYTPGDIQAYEVYAGLSTNILVTNVLDSFSLTPAPNGGNDEVASDIELSIAMAPGLRQVNVYEGTNNAEMINAMAEPSTESVPRPNQISCSWGIEGDTSITQGLIQLGLQGQSFMYAIGDSGAYQNGVNTGTDKNLLYMTAVGGTQLFMTNGGQGWQSEIVWHDPPPTNFIYFASTGGVVNQDPIPYYQQGVSMALNYGSTQYRNVPDVALVARDIMIFYTAQSTNGPNVPGQYSGWVGTSASAPLFAGLIALANQQAASEGEPPLGFLNPAIYEIAEGPLYTNCFHDITSGNNAWTNVPGGTSSDGLYPAVVGYDLCTGWGTSAGPALINALTEGYGGPVFVNFNYSGTQTGSYAQPFNTMAGGISAVSSGGTIIIEKAGSSSETPAITKAMTIRANNGPATIGQ
jgi:subtilase family serine protease